MPTRPDVVEPGEPEQIAATLAAAFEDRSGRAPDGVYAAPGRVNLIGEHLDYNGGRVLPIALPHACYVAAGPRDDALVSVHSLQSEDTWSGSLDDVVDHGTTGFAAYAAGVLWALREDGVDGARARPGHRRPGAPGRRSVQLRRAGGIRRAGRLRGPPATRSTTSCANDWSPPASVPRTKSWGPRPEGWTRQSPPSPLPTMPCSSTSPPASAAWCRGSRQPPT